MIDSYTSFINNWKQAKEAIKSTCNSKPAFARYLEVNDKIDELKICSNVRLNHYIVNIKYKNL